MTVFPSTLVAATSIPTDPESVWSPSVVPFANWRERVVTETNWKTGIQAARSGSEQRAGVRVRPVRVIEALTHGWSQDEAAKLRSMLMRWAHSRSLMPIYSDRSRLNGPVVQGLPTYFCDTTDRRFFVGQRVIVARHNRRPISPEFLVRTIVAKTDTTITLNDAVGDFTGISPSIDFTDHVAAAPGGINWNGSSASITLAADQGALLITCAITNGAAATWTQGPAWDRLGINEPLTFVASDNSSYMTVIVHKLVGNTGLTSTISGRLNAGGANILYATMFVAAFNDSADPFDLIGQTLHTQILPLPGGPQSFSVAYDAFTPSESGGLLIGHALFEDLLTPFTFNVEEINIARGVWTEIANGTAGGTTKYASGYWDASADATSHDFEGNIANHDSAVGYAGAVVAVQADDPLAFVEGLSQQFIFPAFEAEVILVSEASIETDHKTSHRIEALEAAGKSALPPLTTPGDSPAGYSTFDGLPILNKHIDWTASRQFVDRQGTKHIVGTGSSVDLFGPRGRIGYELSFSFYNRSDVFDYLNFVDSRAGSTFPFWILPPMDEVEIIDFNAGTPNEIHIGINGFPLIEWQNWYLYIVIEKYDGTVGIWTIEAASDATTHFVLGVTESISGWDAADVTRASVAFKCRFRNDASREEWITDTVCEMQAEAIEVHDEKTLAADDMDVCPGGSGSAWTEDEDFDICADNRCGSTDPAECCVCMDYPITLECWCWFPALEEDCDCFAACTANGYVSLELDPVSCIAGVARWEGPGGSWAELDTAAVQWTYDIGTAVCCEGLEDSPGCPQSCCYAGCDDIETETCSLYFKEVPCQVLSGCVSPSVCSYVPAVKISCPACMAGSSFCA